jgi:hypothetical protein
MKRAEVLKTSALRRPWPSWQRAIRPERQRRTDEETLKAIAPLKHTGDVNACLPCNSAREGPLDIDKSGAVGKARSVLLALPIQHPAHDPSRVTVKLRDVPDERLCVLFRQSHQQTA